MDASLLAVVLFLVFLGLGVWWLVVLIEAVKIPDPVWDAAGQNKLLYVVLMVVLGAIGSLVYVLVARPPLRAAGAPI
jgi:hypothetical protein